ncbi:WD40 repeat domain-containing protein [Microseira wollei]|uniref:WD-40 repeat-containing protein n=1 Tax=Microseira wollei NIES-4236 TaxID=2530354 RepID=A0AAV3XS18_9CYAN|nr:pentapeptide repeat-containing protein [Microseira wollei]GET43739.1 WD-40 repeat-containing protein [Microseira wollei NIES-4236]
MYWFAIDREGVDIAELPKNILPIWQRQVWEGLNFLHWRSLIEKSKYSAIFTRQPVVMEYITERLINQVCQEIKKGDIELLKSHPLIKAQAKDYIKATQVELILNPVIEKALAMMSGQRNLKIQLQQILSTLREQYPGEPGYAAGNILNLLALLQVDLTGFDFYNLIIWQAELKNVNLHQVNFSHCDLANSIFRQSFSSVLSVAFSLDGKVLATGDANGEIRLWNVADGQHLLTCQGYANWIKSIAFSPDGQTFAIGSDAQTIRVYDVSTGICLQVLEGHSDRVWSIALGPDGLMLASGSEDQTVRLWDIRDGKCINTLQGHTNLIRSVAFSSEGSILASSSEDQTIKLWDIPTGLCLKTFQGHTQGVRTVAFSPNGSMLVSSGKDETIKLWDVKTGECLKTLRSQKKGCMTK